MGVPAFMSFEVFMKITNIEPQKKHKNRMSVFLDDAFAFGIDAFSLYALKLKVGDEIDDAKLSEIKNTVLYESAKNYAVNLISARSYTKAGILKKLREHTGNEELSQKVILFLKEYKLIDDYDYACRFIADCLRIKKLGKRMIAYKLAEKGISSTVAQKAMEEVFDNSIEQENLVPLMEKKLAGDFSFKNVMKTKRYLASKGYSFADIDTAFQKLKVEGDA